MDKYIYIYMLGGKWMKAKIDINEWKIFSVKSNKYVVV